MENNNNEDRNLKTFNTAKVFAESILFPLMFDYKKYQRQANFGHEKLDLALELNDEIREINRFNGEKAMNDTAHDLLKAISSTVKLKGNKEEVRKLKEIEETLDKLRQIFYNDKDRFFTTTYKGNRAMEILDRKYFETIKDIIDACYINIEILMTKNKLLFDDSKDEYLSDKEIMESIKKEFIGE